MNDKIVYVLGAGFSNPAQIPIQSKLLNEISIYNPELDEIKFINARYRITNFIEELFGSFDSVLLEDVFTILDRSILEKERFKKYDWQTLYQHRQDLVYLILFVINKKLPSIPSDIGNVYRKFAKRIIKKRYSEGQETDTIAIISLNWDTVLELFLNQALTKKQKKNTLTDYCTYTHTLQGKGISHVNIKSQGYYNIKVLKLHGSLNWLYCSNCGRLFVQSTKSIGIHENECLFCKTETSDINLYLEPLIITPTFLKELNNLHIKNIWQNAFIDLQEATEIIFIGYSLPLADFELKYILKKAINPNVKIRAILRNRGIKSETINRFKNFFGDQISFYFDGLENWILSRRPKYEK